jgi:hypothetical protein
VCGGLGIALERQGDARADEPHTKRIDLPASLSRGLRGTFIN